MPTPALLIACLLSIIPVSGYAQTDFYALQSILQRYTEAYGGNRDVDALTSLSVEGTIEEGGQSFDFLMRKKRPYSFRYRLSSGANNVISGYNGSEAWMRFETNGEISIKSLDSKQRAILRKQARFDSPLFRHLEKSENVVSLIERTILDKRGVNVIEVVESGRDTSHYYLDAETSHVLRRDQLDIKNGKITFQTFYSDYREVEGFPFAHEVETRVDGQTVSLAKVHSINVNPGLLSFYFEKPSR